MLVKTSALNGRKGYTKNRINTGCHKVLADGDCFFTHPLRSGPCNRKAGNGVSQAALLDHLRCGHQNAAVVHAGSKTQDRRHANCFTDLPQARPRHDSSFRNSESGLGQGDLGAAGLKHQDIVFDQFLDQFHMDPVLFDSGVGTAHNACNTPDSSVDDVVVQRRITGSEASAQHVADVLMRKSVNAGVDDLWNFNCTCSVFKTGNGLYHNFIGASSGIVVIKGNMHRSLDFTPGVGGKHWCAIACGDFGQTLFDTLDIDAQGIDRSSHQNSLGGHEVSGMRNAVTDQHFCARATHSNQVDAGCAGCFGRLNQGWFIHRFQD